MFLFVLCEMDARGSGLLVMRKFSNIHVVYFYHTIPHLLYIVRTMPRLHDSSTACQGEKIMDLDLVSARFLDMNCQTTSFSQNQKSEMNIQNAASISSLYTCRGC